MRINRVWNTALLEAASDPFKVTDCKELKLFSSKAVRRARHAVHTRADPFLFVHDDWLYLFVEVQRVNLPGYIEAYRTADLEVFEALGPILRSTQHFSYPQVFSANSNVYMLPESAAAQEVALYRFDDFPRGLQKVRTLLQGSYADCTIFEHDNLWWLFAYSAAGLELFFASSLSDPFAPHPIGIITSDPAFARCGGGVVKSGDRLYRPAQQGAGGYGANLSIMRIEELTCTTYREICVCYNIFDSAAAWRSKGAHHFSLTSFKGRTIIAVDGQQTDYWFNRFISLFIKGALWIMSFVKFH